MTDKGSLRKTQLIIMGFVALAIAPIVAIVTMVVYGLPFPNSISETGTIANQVSPILPFILGMLAIFSLSYSIVYAYSKADSISTAGMFIGFTIVALQMCGSSYVNVPQVGILGVSKEVSAFLHSAGALIGFGSLLYWIIFCFTKSNLPPGLRTKEKQIRNKIYYAAGGTIAICIILFILDVVGILNTDFPIIFWLEAIVLTFCGIACIIKGELILKDKKES